jgi:geranylgeranyl pyrophosphate synthase
VSPLSFPLDDPSLAAAVTEGLGLVEAELRDAVSHTDPLVDATSRHLVDAGGKRLRPALTLLAAQLGTGTNEAVVKAAAAVELTHLASLYHDDVMDSAPMRRGTPAAHEVWGNSVAVITGDVLFARASRLIAELGPEAVLIQATTFERLCLGQLHETVGPREGDDALAHYLGVLADKTASLIATSARYGAMFGGATPEQVEALARYGEKVGVAFQLADDVIDLASDGGKSGKTPGTDLREHVPTMPVLLLRARAAEPGASAQDRALVDLLDGDLAEAADLARAVSALRAHPVLAETRERAAALALEAVGEIAGLPDGAVKDSLGALAAALVDRAA